MRAFNEINFYDACEHYKKNLKSEIENKEKEYILQVDENEYHTYLLNKYQLEPLTVNFESEVIIKPIISKEWLHSRMHDERYQANVYIFTASYNFIGSSQLFRIHPSSWAMISYDINVDEYKKTVSYDFKVYNQDAAEYSKSKEDAKYSAFVNLQNVNISAESWNEELKGLIKTYFAAQKSKYLKENDFFAAINLPVDNRTEIIFSAPVIKKIVIPQPKISASEKWSSVPTLDKTIYEDILKVIYEAGQKLERKPSMYIGKDEEALRDLFLYNLETRYEGITATGETFNRSGKTDIILKYAPDGSNVFVAECKFWRGSKVFNETINQLFDKYLTWRDSKVAIMIFSTNTDFTSVVNNIATEARLHPYFVKDAGRRGETSFSYMYRLPQDGEKYVYLEVMSFNFDKLN